MSKDKNGKPIQIGSVVSIRGKVVHLSEQPQGHNMTIETLETLPGSANPAMRSQFAVNSSQVEVESEETLDPNRAPATHAAAAGATVSDDGPTERELLDEADKASAPATSSTDDPTKA